MKKMESYENNNGLDQTTARHIASPVLIRSAAEKDVI